VVLPLTASTVVEHVESEKGTRFYLAARVGRSEGTARAEDCAEIKLFKNVSGAAPRRLHKTGLSEAGWHLDHTTPPRKA
jgi:hypothetical protein